MSFPSKEKSAGDTFAIPIIPHGANRPGPFPELPRYDQCCDLRPKGEFHTTARRGVWNQTPRTALFKIL